MLIGIDGRPFYGAAAGTGRYVAELCRQLDGLLPHARFNVYGNRAMQLPVASPRWQACGDPSPLWAQLPASAWYFIRAGRMARHDGVDLFWGGANFLPTGLPTQTPTVVTIYDLVHHLFPETMSSRHSAAYRLFFKRGLRRADRIVAISQGTADRLQQSFGVQAHAIVKPQVGGNFRRPPLTEVQSVCKKYALPSRYLLSVSTLEPRKNLPMLVHALMALAQSGQAHGLSLVLVGQRGWKNTPLLSLLNTARQAGVDITEVGFVPDADLPALYAGAAAVVMPTLYEGFGMPIMEALHCGARVLASDTPETREAGGQAAIYIAPTAPAWQTAIAQLWNQPLATAGAVMPESPPPADWHREAARLAALFRQLL